MNASNRTRIDGQWAPDRNDEYLFYQSLLGAWPAEAPEAPLPRVAPADLAPRLVAYMTKAVREAKVHTSWIDENPAYGEAVERFVERTLNGRTAARFLASFVRFQRRAAPLGMINSLAQLVLKLASPGVVDTYQGSELWNFDLVDPDNRRPVDYQQRRQLLGSLQPLIDRIEQEQLAADEVAALLRSWHDGRIKLFITACGLRLRRRQPALMLHGEYLPIASDGAAADQIVGFVRRHAGESLIAIVPRFTSRVVWRTARVALPDVCLDEQYRHLFTGETVSARTDGPTRVLHAADVFRTAPVALLRPILPPKRDL